MGDNRDYENLMLAAMCSNQNGDGLMVQKYNFENLVLLVGKNPLPNYVVGKYFLMNNPDLKTIWLVYSEKQNDFGTGEIATKIKDVINKDIFKFCPLEDIGDARAIKRNIEEIILKRISSSVHLNYTGGTKAMAVHVYRAIEKYKNIQEKSFSYLDARMFGLIDDEIGIVTDDLRETIDISLENLIKLHGYEKIKEEENFLLWKDSLNEFELIIQAGKLKNYLDWKKIIRKIYYINDEFEESVLKAREKISKGLDLFNTHPFKKDIIYILNTIPQEHSILDGNGNLWVPDENINNKIYKSRIFPSIQFLDGKWLENHVYIKLIEALTKDTPYLFSWEEIPGNDRKRLTDFLNKKFNIDWVETAKIEKIDNDKTIRITSEKKYLSMNLNNEKTEMNLKIDNGKIEKFIVKTVNHKLNIYDIPISLNWKLKKGTNGKDFELDIVIINGYQICGISITTDQKEYLCKSKGFEVFHRVNQIGGDEAKAILITCLTSVDGDQVTKMGEDLRFETKSNILVLGLEDIKAKLLTEITKFIELKEKI